MADTDWQFVPSDQRSGPIAYRIDASVLESDDLKGLREQCEAFVLREAPRALHAERCLKHMAREAVRVWVEGWKDTLLLSEVCFTGAGQVCRIMVTVPHWEGPTDGCAYVSLLHNGSWGNVRPFRGMPEMRKCRSVPRDTGLYLATFDPSMRSLGEACVPAGALFGSAQAWKLCMAE